MATKLSEMLCFAWAGDFECLKQFVGENLKLEGSWTQPGGDKKMFTSDNSTIIWRKNKNLLYLEGEKASDVRKELCKHMCKQVKQSNSDDNNSPKSSCVIKMAGCHQKQKDLSFVRKVRLNFYLKKSCFMFSGKLKVIFHRNRL